MNFERVNHQPEIHCSNGEVVRGKDGISIRRRWVAYEEGLRSQIARQCRGLYEPFCSDKSDLTPETCAWACLSRDGWARYENELNKTVVAKLWACPGEPKCIAAAYI